MHQKLSLSALVLGMIFLGFLCVVSSFSASADAGENFLYLKKYAEREINITNLGLKNKNFLTFKAFEYEESEIFHLGAINKKFLVQELGKQKISSLMGNEVISTTQTFSQIDIWEYLEMKEKLGEKKGESSEQSREKGMQEYLFLAKDAVKNADSHQVFLNNRLRGLEKQISSQKDILNASEKKFQKILESGDKNKIMQSKLEIGEENQKYKMLQIEFSEKKYEYDTLSPLLKKLQNNLQAIEENHDALVKNVKTKKSSGEYIGTVIE